MTTRPVPSELGSLLRDLRVARDMEVEDLVAALRQRGFNTGRSSIYDWESGDRRPRNRKVVAALDLILNAKGAIVAAVSGGARPPVVEGTVHEQVRQLAADVAQIREKVLTDLAEITGRLDRLMEVAEADVEAVKKRAPAAAAAAPRSPSPPRRPAST